MWFYTCKTESFVLFTVQRPNDPASTGDGFFNYFSIGVQGDGYFYIEIRLINNEVTSAIKEKTTNLKVSEGWNYIAVDLDEIYEYSYLTMYHRSETTTLTTYISYFRGYYTEPTFTV